MLRLELSKAQKKLVSHILKEEPTLTDKEVFNILDGFKKFVNIVKRIYTEPQARVTYKDKVIRGKVRKDRVYTTDLTELLKVKADRVEPIEKVFRKFHKSVTKNEKR